jgi:hypothetical protein
MRSFRIARMLMGTRRQAREENQNRFTSNPKTYFLGAAALILRVSSRIRSRWSRQSWPRILLIFAAGGGPRCVSCFLLCIDELDHCYWILLVDLALSICLAFCFASASSSLIWSCWHQQLDMVLVLGGHLAFCSTSLRKIISLLASNWPFVAVPAPSVCYQLNILASTLHIKHRQIDKNCRRIRKSSEFFRQFPITLSLIYQNKRFSCHLATVPSGTR